MARGFWGEDFSGAIFRVIVNASGSGQNQLETIDSLWESGKSKGVPRHDIEGCQKHERATKWFRTVRKPDILARRELADGQECPSCVVLSCFETCGWVLVDCSLVSGGAGRGDRCARDEYRTDSLDRDSRYG